MRGMMIFVTSELTTSPNAFPMTTAMASSIMLPLRANSLNSCHKLRTCMIRSPYGQTSGRTTDHVGCLLHGLLTVPRFSLQPGLQAYMYICILIVEQNAALGREIMQKRAAMTNREIASWLADCADLLEKGGEKLYRTKAY